MLKEPFSLNSREAHGNFRVLTGIKHVTVDAAAAISHWSWVLNCRGYLDTR